MAQCWKQSNHLVTLFPAEKSTSALKVCGTGGGVGGRRSSVDSSPITILQSRVHIPSTQSPLFPFIVKSCYICCNCVEERTKKEKRDRVWLIFTSRKRGMDDRDNWSHQMLNLFRGRGSFSSLSIEPYQHTMNIVQCVGTLTKLPTF